MGTDFAVNCDPKKLIKMRRNPKLQWDLYVRTIRSFLVLIIFYWLSTDLVLFLFRIVQLDFLVATIGSQPLDFEWICYFDNGAESSNLPALESESSSASLATYRNEIAAESEADIYNRIRHLEHMEYSNIPPQNNIGDYERLVREHFDQALNVDHYLEIGDKEFQELQLMEKKALLQERLQELIINEQNIERIMELSPYTEIRKEADFFLREKVAPLNSLEHAFQRHLMEGSLNSFIQDLNTHDRQSDIDR